MHKDPGMERPTLRNALIRILVLSACLCGGAQALLVDQTISAYRIPDNRIKVDGRPDTIWKALSAAPGGAAVISLKDYRKIVLLQPDSVRNDDPSKYYPNPSGDSVTMLAAYDNAALYFFFVVKTRSVVNTARQCLDSASRWKADAPEVFVDPSPWSPDPTVYTSYFSTDFSGLVFGTSPKTVQLAKPIYDKDAKFYFRNRTAANSDRFQFPRTLPTGVSAVSKARTAADTATVGVEMRIPFWGGNTAAFAPGKSMFISWGFNRFPSDSLGASGCVGNPIAYRWAKHYLNYDNAEVKPPGWRKSDSTHYDPTRSWDGWGRLSLVDQTIDPTWCRSITDTANWSLGYWQEGCNRTTTHNAKSAEIAGRSPLAPLPQMHLDRMGRERDLRGRVRIRAGSKAAPAPRAALPD